MRPFYEDEQSTIYCGDCRDIIGELQADCVVTDPPYGETSLKWDRWQTGWIELLQPASMWCCGSMRMFLENIADFKDWRFAQDVVWKKNAGSGFHADRFKRVHEHALHFYRGKWDDIFKDIQFTMDATARVTRRKSRPTHTGDIAGRSYVSHDGGPRMQTSVIEARNCHGYAVHPTQKPVAVIGPLIRYSCRPGGVVLDPFMGSGTTLLAAKLEGKKAIGIEVDKKFCKAAANRLRQKVLYGAEE